MTFPKIIIILVLTILNLSCKKELPDLPKTTRELLTLNTWTYWQYFINYSTTTPILAYRGDRNNNLMDLTKDRIKFKQDGRVDFIKGHSVINGIWHLVENEKKLEIQTEQEVYSIELRYLDEGGFEWYDAKKDEFIMMIKS